MVLKIEHQLFLVVQLLASHLLEKGTFTMNFTIRQGIRPDKPALLKKKKRIGQHSQQGEGLGCALAK